VPLCVARSRSCQGDDFNRWICIIVVLMVHPKDASSNHSTGLNKMEQRSKKKVEWSGNLSSVESVAPAENRSPNWDSETGKHLHLP